MKTLLYRPVVSIKPSIYRSHIKAPILSTQNHMRGKMLKRAKNLSIATLTGLGSNLNHNS